MERESANRKILRQLLAAPTIVGTFLFVSGLVKFFPVLFPHGVGTPFSFWPSKGWDFCSS